jgi:hypothetical protein
MTRTKFAALLISLATALGVVAAAPAQADPSGLATPFRIAYHVPREGYHFVSADQREVTVKPIASQLSRCHRSVSCRVHVHLAYHRVHSLWATYNRQVWNAAEGLPACAVPSGPADCVSIGSAPLAVVRVDETNYLVQRSARP